MKYKTLFKKFSVRYVETDQSSCIAYHLNIYTKTQITERHNDMLGYSWIDLYITWYDSNTLHDVTKKPSSIYKLCYFNIYYAYTLCTRFHFLFW